MPGTDTYSMTSHRYALTDGTQARFRDCVSRRSYVVYFATLPRGTRRPAY
jgi:hypothetical protein